MMGFRDAVASAEQYKQSAPHSRWITTPTPHHSIFTGRMIFPTLNQQCQSAEGKSTQLYYNVLRLTTVSNCFYCSIPNPVYAALCQNYLTTYHKSSVLRPCWLGGRKGIRPVKTEWWGAGMVICLERGADLHTAQLMPLPLTISCFSKIYTASTFLVLAHPGKVKGKVFPYSLPSVGPGADPGVQAVSLQVT